MAGNFERQLTVLESSGCATGWVFVWFSFSKTAIPWDIKIILGFHKWRTVCGTLVLVVTQLVEH
jgi:hypothetical protein